MNPDRDMDRRFEELMSKEFSPEIWSAPDPAYDQFNLSRALEQADPYPDDADQWHAPDPALPRRLPTRVIIGIVILVVAFAVAGSILAGVVLPGWARVGVVMLFAAGLATLLASIPRRWNPPDDHDY